eukprot:jgi/Ulvmu1/9490/UM052_0060.1
MTYNNPVVPVIQDSVPLVCTCGNIQPLERSRGFVVSNMRCQARVCGTGTHVVRSHPPALNSFSAANHVCHHQPPGSAAERVTCYASGADVAYEDRDRQEKFETQRLMDDAEARMQDIIARIDGGSTSATASSQGGATASLRESIGATLGQLTQGLVERDTEARLMLLAALSGEHVLFLGPPGTAKSELSRRLHTCLYGSGYFERLLTRFSVPEELFGPLSMRALERDMYLRSTEGYLPQAEIAFIDEVFKANSAILNTLLTILNERLFDNGKDRSEVPLLCLVAASNELPESEELDALYDRFLLRAQVQQVSAGALTELLTSAGTAGAAAAATPSAAVPLTVARAREVRAEALAAVTVPQPVVDVLVDLRTFMQDTLEPPSYVSDRRLVKAVAVLQVAAYTNGRTVVTLHDTLLLRHMLWSRPEDEERIHDWLLQRLAAQGGSERQVGFLLSSLFGRTCHSMQDEAQLAVIQEELAGLRDVLVETLAADTRAAGSAAPDGGADGFASSLQSLWLSEEDAGAIGEALAPKMRKAREGLTATLFETVTLELAVERRAEAFVLASVMPRYWADFIRSTSIEDARSMGGTRPAP